MVAVAESLDRWCPLMMSIYGACSEELINNYFALHAYAKPVPVPKVQIPERLSILANGSLLSMYETPEQMEERLIYLGRTMG